MALISTTRGPVGGGGFTVRGVGHALWLGGHVGRLDGAHEEQQQQSPGAHPLPNDFLRAKGVKERVATVAP